MISAFFSLLASIVTVASVVLAFVPVVISVYFELAVSLYVSVTVHFVPAARFPTVYVNVFPSPESFHKPAVTFAVVRSGIVTVFPSASVNALFAPSTTVKLIVSSSFNGAPLIVLLTTSDPVTYEVVYTFLNAASVAVPTVPPTTVTSTASVEEVSVYTVFPTVLLLGANSVTVYVFPTAIGVGMT